jgi:hypothetical protein
VGSVAFSWAPNIEASREKFQMTDDAAFTSLLQDRNAVTGAAWRIDLDIAKPSFHFWRLATVRGNADAGPFGDA